MLSLDDRALAGRDPALTGLPVVLSDVLLSDLLGEDVHTTRVRYKPGRSIVAAWSSADGTRHGWVGSHQDPTKLDKAVMAAERVGSWALVLDPEGHVVATDVLGDRATGQALRAIRRRRPDLLDDAQHPPTLLRHNPSRRQVWRCRDLVLRVGAEPVARRHALAATLEAHDVPVLRPRPVDGSATAELLPWWGRGDLAGLPGGGAAASAGRAVARMHAMPVPRGPRGLGAPAWVCALVDVAPAWRDRVLALRRRVDRALHALPHRPAVRLHGDLSPDQVLVDGGDVRLIDLDRATVGAPEQDLGSFVAAAHLEHRHALVAPFLEGYAAAGGTYDRSALATWQAVSLAQRAIEPFRSREADWSRRSAEILADAEQVLP
ncbi:hypothetical protein GCM10009821_02430 [Aeromicrobium halocynthiae]|uniref:Aminoglycoside phosphotransferase domain-containing protein n=2 Tax=Aeromicrobium halocynthiae TaxID=560557 RepID=A0ABN2VR71_9ACTN